MVALELEILAKKFDRFGWERDRNSPAHDRMVMDWIEALQDFPLSEVTDACRAAVVKNPNKMPNEGHIKDEILKARQAWLRANPPRNTAPQRQEPPVTAEAAAKIMAAAGFGPKRMDQ